MSMSLLTNTSAMSALQNLASTQKSLSTVQGQISSGLRVSDASDNAAYWSISTTMKSDTGALSAVKDALSLGSSVVGVASSALTSVGTILDKMKADLVTAQTPGTDKAQVQSDIAAQQQSLKSIISSASFNGVNLLDGTTSNPQIVSSFSRSQSASGSGTTTSTGSLTVDTSKTVLSNSTSSGGLLGSAISITTNGSNATTGTSGGTGGAYDATSLLGFDLSSASTTDLTTLATAIDTAITNVTAAGASLGATKTTIDNQTTFVQSLSDSITSGVGSLVDADMNTASTRLQALQTQQQLGIQSLSIANQNSQMILRLFS